MFLRISIAAHAALLLMLLGNPVVKLAVAAGYLVYHGFLAWGVLHPRSRLFGPNRSRLGASERVVALTFDDGPHPVTTPRVLDILRARGVPATFFMIGRWVERHPEIVRRIVTEGHEVGNHSHGHSYLFWTLSPGRLAREVLRARKAIEGASGRPCRWFRAPVGMKNCFLRRVLERQGLELVSWDIRFLDRGSLDPLRLRARLARAVVPGSILLLHDGHDRRPEGNPAVVEALPVVLDSLGEMGYRCVPLG